MSDAADHDRRLTIEVARASPRWHALPQAKRLCAAAARAAYRSAGAAGGRPAEISIVLGDDRLLQALNKTWRGQDESTNVLAFAAGDEVHPPAVPRLLGDVALAFETVLREAGEQGKTLGAHLSHLVVHGVLHLLGFDHRAAREAARM